MQEVFIAKGEPAIFREYTVLAEPLPDPEDRVFGRQENGNGGTCYRAYSLRLAKRGDFGGSFFLLVTHGAGSLVIRLPGTRATTIAVNAILTLPEPEQFAALWMLYDLAYEADRQARAETRTEYANAFVEGRLRKSRARGGMREVTIAPRVA